ncbi:hypothetical protein [Acidiphilium sp.]|uniref:hypothetical protein n=1 Tax=Acidiphilium sp. TaxID=527 RepID=UPI00258A875F|nr:hypothetical protein [Acidiphilium sp.]
MRAATYSGTGYKGQGKTQPRTAAVYDNPYAWDARAAYVIGTRHRDDYRLFVSRDLVPDLEALAEQILRQRDDRGSSLRFATAGELQVRQEQLATTARATLRAALGKSREVQAAKAAREQRQRQQAAVEKTLSRHRAALIQSGEDRKKLAAAWQSGAEDMAALTRLVTNGWEAARAIVRNPALLAALREEDPDQASEVEAFARQDRDQLIAAAQRRMPQRSAPPPTPAPEPDPEPPTPRMRR